MSAWVEGTLFAPGRAPGSARTPVAFCTPPYCCWRGLPPRRRPAPRQLRAQSGAANAPPPRRAAHPPQDGAFDLSAAPPFSLADVRNAIPSHCFERSAPRSFAYLVFDVAVVLGLAAGAYAVNSP